MNARQILTALAITASATAAMAVEATQFDDTPSTLTREEVKTELARAIHDGTMLSRGEASVFDDHVVATNARAREDVRAEARAAVRDHSFSDLYVGAV